MNGKTIQGLQSSSSIETFLTKVKCHHKLIHVASLNIRTARKMEVQLCKIVKRDAVPKRSRPVKANLCANRYNWQWESHPIENRSSCKKLPHFSIKIITQRRSSLKIRMMSVPHSTTSERWCMTSRHVGIRYFEQWWPIYLTEMQSQKLETTGPLNTNSWRFSPVTNKKKSYSYQLCRIMFLGRLSTRIWSCTSYVFITTFVVWGVWNANGHSWFCKKNKISSGNEEGKIG